MLSIIHDTLTIVSTRWTLSLGISFGESEALASMHRKRHVNMYFVQANNLWESEIFSKCKFATGNTLLCGLSLRPTKCITMHVVQRKHF